MGRHSAADGDEAQDAPLVVAVDPAAARRGRHNRDEDLEDTGPVPGAEMRRLDARAAAQDAQPTELISLPELLPDLLIEPEEPGGAAEGAPEGPGRGSAETAVDREPSTDPGLQVMEEPAGRRHQSTADDLALLRRRADVRNRVIGAVVVPFVLYGAVMLLLGVTGVQYLLWIWIPLVSAGVLAGLILDAAQRHRPAPEPEPEPAPEPEQEPEPGD